MHLVLVESPTKTKTLEKFLGKEYKVLASGGHVRDLPKSTLGVDIENSFQPKYVIPPRARKNIKTLKEEVKKANIVYLATDPDREGEAISYHLLHVLDIKDYKRISFNEITKTAVEEATKNPREIDMNLIDAQQARRVLDRLVGYKLSPFLWKKVTRGLSAGRVQSAALRIIAEREKERESFKTEEYWSISALLLAKKGKFSAVLKEINKEKIEKGKVKGLPGKEKAENVKKDLEGAEFSVKSIKRKEKKRSPLPPFTTSTMQQEAFKRLRLPSKVTMYLAQSLYEKGLITYHRTDSFHLSKEARTEAEKYIKEEFGENYYQERNFAAKGKTQEAHEAIRPTSLDSPKKNLKKEEDKLYDLIKRRFLASLMSEAVFDSTNIEVKASNKEKYLLSSSGWLLRFDGFFKVYPMKFEENELPEIKEAESLDLEKIEAAQHFTKPPARFTEATLVKELEKHGIGRPSTYVPIISRLDQKNYTEKVKKKYLKPTEMGMVVSDLLTKHFPSVTDLHFTARMEEDLDRVAEGKKKWQKIIEEFYKDFAVTLEKKEKEIKKEDIMQEETDEKCEKCGSDMAIKLGKFGKFMACKNFPECKNTKPLEDEKENEGEELICDKCGSKMQIKQSKFGKFYGCSNYPTCKNIKSMEEKLDIKCPECKEGDVVKRKSKKGNMFYACNRYPDCTFTSSRKPSPEE